MDVWKCPLFDSPDLWRSLDLMVYLSPEWAPFSNDSLLSWLLNSLKLVINIALIRELMKTNYSQQKANYCLKKININVKYLFTKSALWITIECSLLTNFAAAVISILFLSISWRNRRRWQFLFHFGREFHNIW